MTSTRRREESPTTAVTKASAASRTPAATQASAATQAPPASGRPHVRTRSASARALLVTVYGLYARDRGGALSVSGLVRLLGALDVDGPAARSLISRLKARGILQPVAVGSNAGYGLTEAGRTLLAGGDRRIYGRPRARLADGWLLAVFSVPESQRAQRHSLRARLAALGFGTVSAGVWIAPAHLAAETADVLRLHHLDRYVELFTAATVDNDPARAVARWWDLDGLAGLYRTFLSENQPLLDRWSRGRPPATAADDALTGRPHGADTDRDQFADYVRAVSAWRRLPYRDPALPGEVLPKDWPGAAAERLFRALTETLGPTADSFVSTVAGPSARGSAP